MNALAMLSIVLTAAQKTDSEMPRPCSIEALVAEAKAQICFIVAEHVTLLPEQAERAVKVAKDNPDSSSIYLLTSLARDYPKFYRLIDDDSKARILIAALKKSGGDGWSQIIGSGPGTRATDGIAARALLLLPLDVTAPRLLALLEDRQRITWVGNQLWFDSLQFRRCDLAYRYLCILEGRKYEFWPMVSDRDKLINSLREELEKKYLAKK